MDEESCRLGTRPVSAFQIHRDIKGALSCFAGKLTRRQFERPERKMLLARRRNENKTYEDLIVIRDSVTRYGKGQGLRLSFGQTWLALVKFEEAETTREAALLIEIAPPMKLRILSRTTHLFHTLIVCCSCPFCTLAIDSLPSVPPEVPIQLNSTLFTRRMP